MEMKGVFLMNIQTTKTTTKNYLEKGTIIHALVSAETEGSDLYLASEKAMRKHCAHSSQFKVWEEGEDVIIATPHFLKRLRERTVFTKKEGFEKISEFVNNAKAHQALKENVLLLSEDEETVIKDGEYESVLVYTSANSFGIVFRCGFEFIEATTVLKKNKKGQFEDLNRKTLEVKLY